MYTLAHVLYTHVHVHIRKCSWDKYATDSYKPCRVQNWKGNIPKIQDFDNGKEKNKKEREKESELPCIDRRPGEAEGDCKKYLYFTANTSVLTSQKSYSKYLG